MTPKRRSEVARKGGKSAHEKGNAHTFNSEEATNAGRKGGSVKKGPRLPRKIKEYVNDGE